MDRKLGWEVLSLGLSGVGSPGWRTEWSETGHLLSGV